MANFPLPKGYQRLDAFPLDETEIFNTYIEAETYAASPSAYAGQKISVVNISGNTSDVYVILPDFTLGGIGADVEVFFKSGTGDYSVEQINSGNTNQSISEGSVTFGKDNLTGGSTDEVLTNLFNTYFFDTPNTITTQDDPTGYSQIRLYEYGGGDYLANILSVTPGIPGPGFYELTVDITTNIDMEDGAYVISAAGEQKYGMTIGENNSNIGAYSFVGGKNNSNSGVTSIIFGDNNINRSSNSTLFGSNNENIGDNDSQDYQLINIGAIFFDTTPYFLIGGLEGDDSLKYYPDTVDVYNGETLIGTYTVSSYDQENRFLYITDGTGLTDLVGYTLKYNIPSVNLQNGSNNLMFGDENLVSFAKTTSIGYKNSAIEENTYTFGSYNGNAATDSIVVGINNLNANGLSTQENSLFGIGNFTLGRENTLIGANNTIKGDRSYTFGEGNTIGTSGDRATLVGSDNSTNNSSSISVGRLNSVNGSSSIIIGSRSVSSDRNNISIGTYADVSGIYSVNLCSGDENFTTTVQDNGSAAIGGYRNQILSTHVQGGAENGYQTIIGGRDNIIDVNAGTNLYNTIINGDNCDISAITNANSYTTIIGLSNYSAIQSNMVYVPALMLATQTTPTTPEEGTLYYDGNDFRGYDGTDWLLLNDSKYTALTAGAAVAFDLSTGKNKTLDVAVNSTITFTNFFSGQNGDIRLNVATSSDVILSASGVSFNILGTLTGLDIGVHHISYTIISATQIDVNIGGLYA